jgi:hypothetical protein
MAAARLAREAEIGELLLTHISGRYKAEEIQSEAAHLFPRVRVAADFDRVSVTAQLGRPHPHAAPVVGKGGKGRGRVSS